MRSSIESPLKSNIFCDDINFAWDSGWLDEFSEDHFIISTINGQFKEFIAYHQMRNNSPLLYDCDNNFCMNFIVNFSSKIGMLRRLIGDKNTERFFKDQVSAGKNNYEEAQFFRALSEINIIRHYCLFNNKKPREIHYEPPLGGNGKNPEIRIEYEDNYLLDIEVKTPGFNQIAGSRNIVLPTILLSNKGRIEINDWCEKNGATLILPRVLKLKDFINSASEKFQNPTSKNHFNLLFINWTYSDFPSNGFLEAYSLLANEINGIFNDRTYGEKVGINDDAYDKISAVIVYSGSLEEILFQDFRYLWATRKYSIIPNKYLITNDTDFDELYKNTGMDYRKNVRPHFALLDFDHPTEFNRGRDFSELTNIIKTHAIK